MVFSTLSFDNPSTNRRLEILRIELSGHLNSRDSFAVARTIAERAWDSSGRILVVSSVQNRLSPEEALSLAEHVTTLEIRDDHRWAIVPGHPDHVSDLAFIVESLRQSMDSFRMFLDEKHALAWLGSP